MACPLIAPTNWVVDHRLNWYDSGIFYTNSIIFGKKQNDFVL
jgi:hypothetical protein